MKIFETQTKTEIITIPDFVTMKSYRDTEYGVEIVFRDADEILKLEKFMKTLWQEIKNGR